MKRRSTQLARRNSNVFAQFDQKQITEFKEAFSFIDQNGDGVIDREDLKEVWASLGKDFIFNRYTIDTWYFLLYLSSGSAVDEKEINEMLKDSPGSLNFTMFLAIIGDLLQVYCSSTAATTAADLLHAFEQFDREKTGRIEGKVLKELMSSIGNRMNEEEIEMMLQEAPKAADSEGRSIDYREFVKLIKTPF